MAKKTDWLPGSRTEILAMCLSWILCLTEVRRTAWVAGGSGGDTVTKRRLI
jgi:hypothetical protein